MVVPCLPLLKKFEGSLHTPFAFALMFEPVRGGTRGGQAEFKWTDVSADKDREVLNFNAPFSLL